MAVGFSNTNKPLNPRGQDASPKGYNRAALYSGKALDFDGVNDDIETSAVPLPSAGAVCFYYQADATGGEIAECGGSTDDFRITINSLCGFYTGTEYRVSTSGLWPIDDKFHFVVLTWGDFGTKFYLNGQFLAENTNRPADFSSVPTTLYIGARNGSSNEFDGQMAGFKIFNTALTAAQVADLYNNPEKVVPTGVADSALKLWLPMMEGAGTTAYDGSGNGNHGTISGATYVHGIGAPVAQSAVIDWNKGVNIINDSEFTASSTATPNLFRGFSRNSTTEESPFGTFDAVKMTENNTNSNPGLVFQTTASNSNPHTIKAYIKADAATSIAFATNGSTNPGNINVTTEWQAFEVTQSGANNNPHIGGFATITQGSGIVLYVWHPQLQEASSAGPYVGTIGTAQTSPVLLPQGLTTGRDITGVNLFENVRKQGALNLDGNSWAEVHDNASVDLTDGVSLECWVYRDGESGYFGFIGKWVNNGNRSYLIATEPGNVIAFYISKNGSALVQNLHTLSASGWHHLVGTEDGTNLKLYVDGVLVDTDATIAGDIFASAYNLEIGRYNNSTSNEYGNQIAQPRIYNRALTASEVLQNYNSGKNTYK